jgi:hypothetical protein
LPVVVTAEQTGEVKPGAPRVLRLVQGTGYALAWSFAKRTPDAKPPETVGADVSAPPAAEIQVRRARTDKKVEKYAEKGEFNVLTTTRTPPEKFDLVLSGQSDSEDTEDAALLTPVITLEIVQGYSVTAPREPVALQRGGKAELAGAFHRQPEFTQPVSITAEFLPSHVSCRPAELHAAETEYRLSCEAEASAKPGEYEVQLTPASVVVGLDKREVPYKIAPVTAKLIISETKTTQAAR